MPVVAKTLRPCPEPKSTISGWTLALVFSGTVIRFKVVNFVKLLNFG
jgi:hypothetical protein